MFQLMRKVTAILVGLCILVGGFLLLSFGVVFVLLLMLLAGVMAFLGLRRPGSVLIFQTRTRPPDGNGSREQTDAASTCIDLDSDAYSGHSRTPGDTRAPQPTLPGAEHKN